MDRKFFGTDGIRGRANVYPLTGEFAYKLGRAVTYYFETKQTGNKTPLIVVGKDTRLSCYMLEQAFSAGVCAQGGNVILTGPLPTPGVAFAAQSLRADAGLMISASHNPYYDNGLKLFNAKGHKLSDEMEQEIEKLLLDDSLVPLQDGENLGKAKRLDEIFGRYTVKVKSALDGAFVLDDKRIVIDCANGAAYKIAPMILCELGADVIIKGNQPNGKNINERCGAMFPEHTGENVLKYRADIGICLDGDADRLILADEEGHVVDGDVIIGILAQYLLDSQAIDKQDEVVGTILSNMGLEIFIKNLGLNFFRSNVGDRYIVKRMLESDSKLGGEGSGHIILKDFATTGDGLLAALKVLEAMGFYNLPLSKLASKVTLYPQYTKNLRVKEKKPLDDLEVVKVDIKQIEKKLGDRGRIVLRYSGTESLLRIMVEAADEKLANDTGKKITLLLGTALGLE